MILITTAGKVGAEAARLLAERGEPVRVLVRNPRFGVFQRMSAQTRGEAKGGLPERVRSLQERRQRVNGVEFGKHR